MAVCLTECHRFSVRETFTDVLNPIPDDSSEEGKDFREEFRQKNNKKTMDYIENLNPLSYRFHDILLLMKICQ